MLMSHWKLFKSGVQKSQAPGRCDDQIFYASA